MVLVLPKSDLKTVIGGGIAFTVSGVLCFIYFAESFYDFNICIMFDNK